MTFFGRTDIGKKRKSNQDCFLAKQLSRDISLFVVCDGMGGSGGGDIASALAVECFCERIERFVAESEKSIPQSGDITSALGRAIAAANREVYQKSKTESALEGMGTTLVAVLTVGKTAYIVNVGDSRLYSVDSRGICQLTTDHSLVQHLISIGDLSAKEAENHPHKNVIMRAVGIQSDVKADTFTFSLAQNAPCCLLLCSDGLSGQVSAQKIEQIVRSDMPINARVDALIDAANQNGGPDNITAVLIEIEKIV